MRLGCVCLKPGLFSFFFFAPLCVQMEDLDFPEIKRKKLQERKANDKKEFKDLFESDSDSGDESAGLKVKGKKKKYIKMGPCHFLVFPFR